MVEPEQVRPLAPAAQRLSSDDDEVSTNLRRRRRRKHLKCCCCIAGATLIPAAAAAVVLAFTVFRIKDPIINLNGVTIDQLDLVNGTTLVGGANISLTADVSVKNPNFSSFRYRNTTTTITYRGAVVGEVRGPPGKAKARKTVRMNLTVEIMPDSLILNPNLQTDIASAILPLNTYSRVPGRVKMLNMIKRHVVVKMNCTVSVNITSISIQEQECKRRVDF